MVSFQLTTGETVVVEGRKFEYAKGIVEAARKVIDNRDVWACALACAEVESRLLMYANTTVFPETRDIPHDLDGSDHSSVGLFQQRPDYGWGTPRDCMSVEPSTRSFLGGPNGPRRGGSPRGLLDRPNWETKIKYDPGDLIDDVQISAFPDRYRYRFPGIYVLLDACLEALGAGPGGSGEDEGGAQSVVVRRNGVVLADGKRVNSRVGAGGVVEFLGCRFDPDRRIAMTKDGPRTAERMGVDMWALRLNLGKKEEESNGGGHGDGSVINPLPGAYDFNDPFGSLYGGRRYPHTGSDFNRGVGSGTPLPAMSSGEVTHVGYTSYNGNCVTVRMDNGDGYYAYIHMLDRGDVSVGQHVATGQILGRLGNTGSNSLGAHLHITCSKGPGPHDGIGPLFDPYAYIRSKGGAE